MDKTISYSDHKKAMRKAKYEATKTLAKVKRICQIETERKFTPRNKVARWIVELTRSIDTYLRHKN